MTITVDDAGNESLERRRIAATPRGVAVAYPFYAQRARNAELWDVQGRRYIDFAAGIAVTNTGHRHPKVLAAIAAQLECFTHTAFQVVPYASYLELAERINALVPGTGANKSAFFTTGAEAVENAIKIARAFTRRPAIIAFGGAFHGRTMLGMALTGKVVPYKVGFGPFPGDVFHVPFPSVQEGVSTDDTLKALQHMFKSQVEPSQVAAIIVEPVQGEGGFNVAPPEFIRALRALCDTEGILLIADEIQCGFGRTGKMFAMEHYGVAADLTTVAKGLAGGMPLSGVCGRADVMDAAAPGGLGGTYAGNPVSVAAALAVLDVLAEEKLLERAAVLGEKLRTGLLRLAGETPRISEVRGLGAMVAVEFRDPATRLPDPDLARAVHRNAADLGLLVLGCGISNNAIRFLFPLTISDALFDEGLGIFCAAVRKAVGSSPTAA